MSPSPPNIPPTANPSPARILVAEDDRKTADLVALYLRHAGHHVDVEYSGDKALARLADARYDLLLLDVMLPGVTGLELLRREREARGTAAILLTARTQEHERVAGLELGADDYVSKPFSPRELVARVDAVLRRVPVGMGDRLVSGPIEMDLSSRIVTVGGHRVTLTRSEFAILEALLDAKGRVCSRGHLLSRLPQGELASDRTIDVHVSNLRRKLGPLHGSPVGIETVTGVGYRLGAPHPTAAR